MDSSTGCFRHIPYNAELCNGDTFNFYVSITLSSVTLIDFITIHIFSIENAFGRIINSQLFSMDMVVFPAAWFGGNVASSTDHEIPGSILSSTVGFFNLYKNSVEDCQIP